MLIKAFPHGIGGGYAPVNYVTGTHYHGREKFPPIVLRGDPELTKNLINDSAGQGRKWNFTAGVIAWHPDDNVTQEKEKCVMDSFEEVAFAGLSTDASNILWVRHEHAGHHELHFVIPRVELTTGKAFNPLPPGWQKDMDVLRDLWNEREGWASPNDPARARSRQLGNTGLVNSRRKREGKEAEEDLREMVHFFIEERIVQGQIRDRASIISSLQDVGFEVGRAGKNYITFTSPDDGKKYRLKGGVYDENWSIKRTLALQAATRQGGDRSPSPQRIESLERELERIFQKRSDYNRKRYSGKKYRNSKYIQSNVVQFGIRGTHDNTSPIPGMVPQLADRLGNSDRTHNWDTLPNNRFQFENKRPEPAGERPEILQSAVGEIHSDLGGKNMGYDAYREQGKPIHSSSPRQNTKIWLEHGKKSCLETGVGNDRIRTTSSHWVAEVKRRESARMERTTFCNAIIRSTVANIGKACTGIGNALYGVRKCIAALEHPKAQQILNNKNSGMSR